MKIVNRTLFMIILVIISIYFVSKYTFEYETPKLIENINFFDLSPKVQVEKIILNSDYDNDGILDLDDIVEGARMDILNKPRYIDKYYSGGYPPDNEGVCTDVIWRAFKNAGYNLKEMVDNDIKSNVNDYPRIRGEIIDPNIDFRRVSNLVSYFQKYATELTIEIIPKDTTNLSEWQGGDIVVFDYPFEHIAIVSDKRNKDGVPYMIHNAGPYTREGDELIYWNKNVSKITHHFRFPKVE